MVHDDEILNGYGNIVERYGPFNGRNWPDIGCGATFLAFGRGASQVMQVRLLNGTWEAFATDMLPQELDDAIKVVHLHWIRAMGKVGQAEAFYYLPKQSPYATSTPILSRRGSLPSR